MIKRIQNRVIETGWYKKVIDFLKRNRFRSGVSFMRVLFIFVQKIKEDAIGEKSSAVAFSFTLSIFPAIIFLFTLIPLLQDYIPNLDILILEFLEEVMPVSTYEAAEGTIQDIVTNKRSSLLSFGFLFAVYLATNGMMSLMRAFNNCYKTVESRGFLKTRLIATGLTFLLALTLVAAIVFLIIGQFFLSFLVDAGFLDDFFLYYLVILMRFLVIFLVFWVAISLIYYFGPAVHEKWSFFSLGSVFAALASIAVSFGFTYYINNFGTYNKLYGSIGALIAFMIWLSILSTILLVGFEINASLDKAKHTVFKSGK
jgi:membrane protein